MVLDRLKLLGWALVFVVGVLLVNPIAFEVGRIVSNDHGIVAGVIIGLFAAGLVGFILTAAAMSRSSDIRRLPDYERRKEIVCLYAAALCFLAAFVLEGVTPSFSPSVALPVAALLAIVAFLLARRMQEWAFRQATKSDGDNC